MELMEVITSKENLNRAYKKVAANKGAETSAKGIYTERQWKEKAIRYTDSIGQNHTTSRSTTNIRYL